MQVPSSNITSSFAFQLSIRQVQDSIPTAVIIYLQPFTILMNLRPNFDQALVILTTNILIFQSRHFKSVG